MTIRPISDLRNYPSVLEDIKKSNNPVILTKNGKATHVIMETAEFENYTSDHAKLQLALDLNDALTDCVDGKCGNLSSYLKELKRRYK